MCRLAEVRDNLVPIIEELKKRKRFDERNEFIIGDPENDEKLSLILREDNLHNTITTIILFENINLEILGKITSLDFQIELNYGDTNHISIYDLELLLVPNDFLQEHSENEIDKEIIACWNAQIS